MTDTMSAGWVFIPPPPHAYEEAGKVTSMGMGPIKTAIEVGKINWLPGELNDLAQRHFPTDGDIDTNGVANKVKLTEAITAILRSQHVFCNIYQLKQLMNILAGKWGFSVAIQGWGLECALGKKRTSSKSIACTESTTAIRETREMTQAILGS
jgi:hypothetical protein